MAILSDANTVGDVYFRLFSTKFPGSKSLLEWEDATDSEERILFDEDTQTASLVEDTKFDPTLKTIVVAHGNTGKLQVDRLLWKSYSEAANNGRLQRVFERSIHWVLVTTLQYILNAKLSLQMFCPCQFNLNDTP